MKLFCFFILIVFKMSSFAQIKPDSALHKLTQDLPKQKIYIHYDKDGYFAGENIWFKAYVYSSFFPDTESRNLFVRLVDDKGNVVQEKKYPILGATVAGNFYLSDSLPQSDYYVYAFTPPLLNGDENNWYKKSITILQRNNILLQNNTNSSDSISIRFFPEGGSFIGGIKQTIAFEALQQDGLPAEVSFKIINQNGNEIKRASSYQNGMGKFELTTMANSNYSVELIEPQGKKIKYQFPKSTENGVQLNITSDGHLKRFLISKSTNDILTDSVRLIVHQQHEIIFNELIAFNDFATIAGAIDIKLLRSGIINFCLFSKNNLPIAERLVFVNNNEFKSKMNLNTPKIDFNKRAKNEFEVVFDNKTQTSASISITDNNATIVNFDKENIFSRLLLTEDIKGSVYNAAWYFDDANENRERDIDILLLTHGWKHYDWNKILNNNFFIKAPNDNPFITLTGNVFSVPDNKPMKGGSLSLIFKYSDGESTFETTQVAPNGSFIIDSIIARGATQLLFTYMNPYNETVKANVKINMDSLNYWSNTTDQIISTDLKKIHLNNEANKVNSLKNIVTNGTYVYKEKNWGNGKVKIMETATVTAKKLKAKSAKDVVDARYSSGAFSTMSRKMIDLVNEPHYTPTLSVWDYLKNYMPVDVVSGASGEDLKIVSRTQFSLQTGTKWPVAVYLDEMELGQGANLSVLKGMYIEEVGLIKYWGAGFIGAVGNAPGGALAIYTKKPQDRYKAIPSPMNKYNFEGYSVIEEFYSPDYTIKDARHANTDTRTTLYWSPNLITDGVNNKIKVAFFNNDFTTNFKIVVEGFDASGKLLHEEKIITSINK